MGVKITLPEFNPSLHSANIKFLKGIDRCFVCIISINNYCCLNFTCFQLKRSFRVEKISEVRFLRFKKKFFESKQIFKRVHTVYYFNQAGQDLSLQQRQVARQAAMDAKTWRGVEGFCDNSCFHICKEVSCLLQLLHNADPMVLRFQLWHHANAMEQVLVIAKPVCSAPGQCLSWALEPGFSVTQRD